MRLLGRQRVIGFLGLMGLLWLSFKNVGLLWFSFKNAGVCWMVILWIFFFFGGRFS